MRKDTCARCGRQIHLVKLGPDRFRWAIDPEKPADTWKCEPTKDFPLRSHAPVSMQAAHR